MHVSEMLAEAKQTGQPKYSFEFFPPKTAQGVQNLYDRMDRMHGLGPSFIDITWGAGGRQAQLTCEMVSVAQSQYGLETCMHLTCTDMGKEKVDDALKSAYKAGCTNILALRGDPPREKEKWTATEGGFHYAKDLVKYIKQSYANHFDIGVAGYPEGCDDQDDPEALLDHLKEKVDAGATFIVTQMFYDVDNFLNWVAKVRARGVTIPIIPGIMPINTYASFVRRCNHMNASIPPEWSEKLEAVKNDDSAVRSIGTGLVAEMCRKILDSGEIHHLHFYTMNLAQATRMLLDELNLTPSTERPLKHALPWRQSLGLGRREEDVRPIFWKNRNKSYVARTQDWDEFPNGRWGDSRSPAFGELDAYGIGLRGTNEQNRKLWGEPKSISDIANIFVNYLEQSVDSLPWSEAPITSEADVIKQDLIALNRRGLVEKDPELTYYSVNKAGDLKSNSPGEGPNAVTWGVFPGKEIVQPTIVETISFLAWKDEAYRLGMDWAHCYDAGSPSRQLIEKMMNEWHLVNIVHNDFHQSHGLFPLFDGLTVQNINKPFEATTTNGVNGTAPKSNEHLPLTNGTGNALVAA
ncbi:FAD-linked oxidoreductase [Glarea lozoyensis ATCC 20868]|uniref:FAD-linked oxidoreductase n=1 Tax=Glarea lozoyensis (strain ATCC 20868 / MF5171) TaxID=1116229 RepID=S3DH25_GLAL2|nr:FAD-linked oxidoreductase [Glarea lozoyensis ATCC 20868]EPE31311.1 FAD-linked oxidoreductase [Glarea lozoyensis ATCC 20868]